MKRFFFDCGTRETGPSLAMLFLRFTMAPMMLFGHGLMKLHNYDALLKKGWPVPGFWPFSHMTMSVSLIATIAAEMGASGLIIVGLATRPAAFVLGFAMAVAAFQVGAGAPFIAPPEGGASKEMAVLYLLGCFVLIICGAGRFSLDNPISKDKRRRR